MGTLGGAGAPEMDLVLLSETQAGDAIRLERVSEELEIDHNALVYLDDHGFVPAIEDQLRRFKMLERKHAQIAVELWDVGLPLDGVDWSRFPGGETRAI